MSELELSGQLALEYCKRLPTASSLMIARMLKRDHTAVYATVETARQAVRKRRGAQGAKQRAASKRAGTLVERVELPEAEPPQFKTYTLPSEPKRWLVLADLHIPYHDNTAIQTTMNFALKRDKRCDGILILGDLIDCYQLSSWQRDPRKRDFAYELELTGQMLDMLQVRFNPKRIVWKSGNHEYRYDRYMMKHAPELVGVDDFTMPKFMKLRERDITWIPRGCPLQHKKLTLLHGDEWGGGSSAVNPARTAFLKSYACCMVAHLHRTSEHTENTVNGVTITCWSVGGLCDLHPEYAPMNKWNHGFAILDTTSNWRFENYRIIDGEVV